MNKDPGNIKQDDPVLTAENIHKSFGRNSVLKGLSLELSRGRLYGITGENGSGKTTILNILAGFCKADKGSIRISCKVGFCPQEPYLFSNLTVEENIKLFSYAYGLNKTANQENFKEYRNRLYEVFNFNGNEKKTCSKLSEGTRQKLNLIISLLHDPDLVLMDEPYAALDWDTYSKFWNFAAKLKEQDRTILVVSHLIYDKEGMDSIWKLNNGLLVCE